jgi:hypothetical protein
MPLQNNCLRAISGAYKATPIRNLEVEVGVPPLGIHLDSLQARFRVRLEGSEVAGVIKNAVEKVARWLTVTEEGRRRRRRNGTRGRNSGDSRGRNALSRELNNRERGGTAVEATSDFGNWERRAPQGSPQMATTPTTLHQSRLSRALQWLPDDDPRRRLSLRKRVLQKAQQSWHSM